MSEASTRADPDPGTRRFDIEGRSLGYPTEFRDGCSAAGLFLVKSRVANQLIAESGFETTELLPGRAMLALTCVHYTDTDCGVYEEIAFAFFVKEVGGARSLPYLGTWANMARGRVASYTWKLQVTTALSKYAGLRMWGFPKTLEEIDFDLSDRRARFTLRMDGEEVLSYSVHAQGKQQPSPLTSPVYSVFQGAPHVSYLSQQYRDTGVGLGGGQLSLGRHPLAEELRSLGLGRRPLLATWNGHLAFSMSAPEKL
jgi:hypothetical protein